MSTRRIHIEFLDAQTGQIFAATDVAAEQLPQSFEMNTVIKLSNIDWQVLKAEPMTAAEFMETGQLRLTLSKIIYMPTENILFSLPTICDFIPAVVPEKTAKGRLLQLHEDDWRQIEFVSASLQKEIMTELVQIADIYKNHREGAGFNQIHIRKEIEIPINCQLTVQQVHGAFDFELKDYDALTYLNSLAPIGDAFAWEMPPFIVYGHTTEATVDTLALHFLSSPKSASKEMLKQIEQFMKQYDLQLVDWVRAEAIFASATTLESYFQKFA